VTLPRPGRLIFALSGLAALAVALVGTLLLLRYREATLAASADREVVLVRARADQLSGEIRALVDELGRLSRLAEVDLADGNLEPEKVVLKAARRDSAVLSASIAILDQRGEVAWAEPPGARPQGPGAALVGLSRGRAQPVLRFSPGEIAAAAPVAGQGAMVAFVSGERDLFGPDLRRSLRVQGAVSLVLRGAHDAELIVASAEAGPTPAPGLRLAGPGQAWLTHAAGRWLVTEAPVAGTGLTLRLTLSAAEVEGELSGPFHRLVALVALAFLLAMAAGAALARLVRQLERAELELDRSRHLAAMGQTAAAIAHEVKNALNGISMGVDMLAAGKASPEVLRTVHGRARAEVERLRQVADDLTLFAATPRLTLERLDLAQLCRTASERVAELAEDCQVQVRVAAPAPVEAQGDAAKLLGALINLARNGIEAMGPGGFGESLGDRAATGPRLLEISARTVGHHAVMEVADRGPGLAPEIRARLFEPFLTTKRTGTGLGLAIARRVLEAHGGTVQAGDREGGGTVFTLALPAGAGDGSGGAAGEVDA
jgi:two-component system C4-dicarboxylate transport sensor histidine kinase DctB